MRPFLASLWFLAIAVSLEGTAAKCHVCGKTAYPTEQITASSRIFHQACFKCSACALPLNINSYKFAQDKLFCAQHAPVASAKPVADTVAVQESKNGPKKTAESTGSVQKGAGKKP